MARGDTVPQARSVGPLSPVPLKSALVTPRRSSSSRVADHLPAAPPWPVRHTIPDTRDPEASGRLSGRGGPLPPCLPGPSAHVLLYRVSIQERRGRPRWLSGSMPAAPHGGGGGGGGGGSVRSETRPSSHNKGGRERAGGEPGGAARPGGRSCGARGGGGGSRETGSRVERTAVAGEEARRPSAPEKPSGRSSRGEHRSKSRSRGPAARAPTSNFPGAARRPGAGGGGRDQSARSSGAPPPPSRSTPLQRGGGVERRPPLLRRLGQRGLQPSLEEWSRGVSPAAGQTQAPRPPPLVRSSKILAT